MKTREEIITQMCYTWRHDYGLTKQEHDGPGGLIESGLTEAERKLLWRQMAQIFDNDIAPHMEFRHKFVDQSWAVNPDRSGGAFTEDEINNHGRWI